MFRLSDYDFESCGKDYVAFMDVFKKFLDLCHVLNEPMRGNFTEAEMIEHAENYALEYIEMRQTKKVSSNLADFVEICEEYLDYSAPLNLVVDSAKDYDDRLWDIYEDLS